MSSPQSDADGDKSRVGNDANHEVELTTAQPERGAASTSTFTPDQPPSTLQDSGTASSGRETMPLWLRRTDQIFVGILLIALAALLIAHRWKLSNGFRTEIEITSQQPREFYYALDINQASWVEWAQLDGIGEKLAKRIVQDRQDRGPFQSIEDVQRVKGVGPKMMEKLRPFLKIRAVVDQGSSEVSQRPE